MDPYFIVYDLIPTSLGSISSPYTPQTTTWAQTFQDAHFSDKKKTKIAKTRNQWTATGATEGHLFERIGW